MSSEHGRGPLWQRLLDLNTEAFAAGRYEAAYHALMAAVHAVHGDGAPDAEERLLGLAGLARDLGRRLDAAGPHHPLASAAAGRRGNVGIFPEAARTAENLAELLRLDQLRERLRQAQRNLPG